MPFDYINYHDLLFFCSIKFHSLSIIIYFIHDKFPQKSPKKDVKTGSEAIVECLITEYGVNTDALDHQKSII